MNIKVFNMDLIKKKSLKVVKVAIIGVSLIASLTACGKLEYKIKEPVSEVIEIEDTTNSDLEKEPVESQDGIRDVSEDYKYTYIGDTSADAVIVASPENMLKYKGTDNAFTRTESLLEDVQVSMSEEANGEFKNYLDTVKVDIPYSELFNLEHLLKRDINTQEDHSHTFRLVNGRIDSDILFETVKKNNAAYNSSDYKKLSDKELRHITEIVAETINYNIENNKYLDMEALLCNLGSLKVFGETNVTNARITYDNVLAISYSMIDNLQNMIDEDVDAFDMTIAHEANHIPQLNCDDEIDKTTGNIIGFNRKWSDEPINSLLWKWYYEAAAETQVMNESGEENIVYETQTNYLKYLKLALMLDENFEMNSLEEVSSSRNREDFFRLFGATSEEDKLEIAKIMYAIELIQHENDDFEEIYLEYTGISTGFVSSEEWVKIKRELKSAIAVNLSTMFYERLANLVKDGTLSLNDVYYLITVFEAEIESHNTYDSINRFEANKPFMESYIAIQDAFFSSIEASYQTDEIIDGFNSYSLKSSTSFDFLESDKKHFITDRQEELIEHTTTNIRGFYDMLLKQYETTKALNMD